MHVISIASAVGDTCGTLSRLECRYHCCHLIKFLDRSAEEKVCHSRRSVETIHIPFWSTTGGVHHIDSQYKFKFKWR